MLAGWLSGVRLFVGADACQIQGRRFALTGDRCFSAVYSRGCRLTCAEAAQVSGLLDSGAFSDPPEKRLTPAGALERQLSWEGQARRRWGLPWRALALVSYDLLIDEKWTEGARRKARWGVVEAERAVEATIAAAAYLASRRRELAPRRLVLACQGVDDRQYEACVRGVLAHARPGDWLGLGGWCILGRNRSWLPTFWAAMRQALPLVRARGVGHCHIFGVLYRPVLGGLLWLCDRHGLSLSTDSAAPALAPSWKDP